MEKFLTSLRFFPSAARMMALKIGHSAEYIEIHKDKVISSIEQFVLVSLQTHKPSCEGHQIEERLECEEDKIECAGTNSDEGDVGQKKYYHRYGGKAPAQHAVANELKGYQRLMEGVKHTAEPPDTLQTACSDAALAFRFLVDIGGAIFLGISVRGVGDTFTVIDNKHRHHEVVKEGFIWYLMT